MELTKIFIFMMILALTTAQTTSFLSALPNAMSAIHRGISFLVPGSNRNGSRPSHNLVGSGDRLVYLTPQVQFGSFFNFFNLFGPKNPYSITRLYVQQRTFNGEDNNRRNHLYGSIGIPLVRRCPAKYADNLSQPYGYDKSPREISNVLGDLQDPAIKSRNNLTMMFVIFGQFLDHDLSLTEVNQTEEMDVKVPKCDNFFDEKCNGNESIPFKRSLYLDKEGTRDHPNLVTAWIDASQVYGQTKEIADKLRTFKLGKLKEGPNKMLPEIEGDHHGQLDAGDIRANENILLTTYHTIFMRQHNRLCEAIIQNNPFMRDEEIYQSARVYVGALMQKITYDDFLPLLLGPEAYEKYIGEYEGYDREINPDIETQFSTAAFRIGHSLLVDSYPFVDRYGDVVEELTLSQMFFRPDLMTPSKVDNLIRGTAKNLMKEKNPQIINSIRNLLILAPDERHINLDLYSLNLQRARDHGINTLNEIRKEYGLKKLHSFDELTKNKDVAQKLKNLYHHPDHCDLWVAIISEDPLEGAVMGETGAAIVGEQFRRIRDGDRYYFDKKLPPTIAAEIKTTTLSEIFMRNSGVIELQENLFQYHAH